MANADQPAANSAEVHILLNGYIVRGSGSNQVASTVSFVRDGETLVVVDPGMAANHAAILEPLKALGVAPEDITDVIFSHHHPDHTMNAPLFPNAEVIDFWARYRNDLWLDHPGDGWDITPNVQLWLTPGHTEEDLSLIVHAEDAVYALTHLWWRQDRTPEEDPYAPDQAVLQANRARVLAVADIVIPGHGEAFRVGR